MELTLVTARMTDSLAQCPLLVVVVIVAAQAWGKVACSEGGLHEGWKGRPSARAQGSQGIPPDLFAPKVRLEFC